MEYDPSQYQQYRERHNASWNRIRHDNASSVRSEPADPSYIFNNLDYNYNTFQVLPQQEAAENYASQNHQLVNIDFIPIESAQSPPILDHSHSHPTLEHVQFIQDVEENEEEEEISGNVDDSENSDDEDDEIDRPDVYCMECNSKIEDTNIHDVATCSKMNPYRFQCTTCKMGFNYDKNLKVHKVLKHMKAIDFVRGTSCHFCPKDSGRTSFNRFAAYIGHIKVHDTTDMMSCEQCGILFKTEKELDRHIRRDHSNEVYELVFCPKCKKIITLEESVSHSQLHTALNAIANKKSVKSSKKSAQRKPIRKKKFVCSECQKAFVRPSELARHEFVHLRAKAAAISSAIKADPTSTKTVQPFEIPKWKCFICAKEYAHESGLLEHKKTAHGNSKHIVCQVCGISFTKKSNHDRHMLAIHPVNKDEKDKRKFECADCPTAFSTMGSLTKHRRACHNDAPITKMTKIVSIYERHVCKTCKREFGDERMLKKHSRYHLTSEYRWRDLQGGGERKCTYCDQSFVLRASLIWHMQKHFEEEVEERAEPEQPPFCSLCDLHFFSQQEFRQHQDEQHSVICGVCHQKFSSRQVYEDHICNRKFATRNVNNQFLPSNRVLICRQCRPPQRLTTARQVREHRLKHLPRKSHLCWTCHKSFRTAQLLSLHAEVHDRQPIQCAHCPQVFHSRVALKQHIRISHGGDTNYQCVVHVDRSLAMSAQSFAEYGLAADHADEQAHRAHSVTEWMDSVVPEEEAITQDDQELRYQVVANNSYNVQTFGNTSQTRACVNGDTQQPIRCEVCHHLYNNIELLCDHWQGSDTDTDHSYGIVTCPICESRIRGASEAAIHLRSFHLFARPKILDFMKPATTDVIPVTGPSESLALALVPSTSDTTIQQVSNRKHRCAQCSKCFTRKNDLTRHMKIHTGEREHQCMTCSKSFRLKSTLSSHMQTHTLDPPQFECSVCQRGFFDKRSLVVHMRIHTGEQPFKCRFCDLHFRTTSMVRSHEKKCAYGGPYRPILPDPSNRESSTFQPQIVAPQVDVNRTITQISSLPQHSLTLSRNSAFNAVHAMSALGTSGDSSIYVITKPITQMQYVVIVQKTKPAESTMRYAVDTVSEIKINQLQGSTNLSIVLHNDMRLNLNTVKMLEMLPALGLDDAYKARVTVGDESQEMGNESELFSIFAHNKTSGVSSFIRRCEICELDLPTKRISDAHFYSEDHETAQLMYPTKNTQPVMSVDRNLGRHNVMAIDAETSEFNCKLCGSRFLNMNSLLDHIRREHDEPVIPPRPIAHTAPIN